MSQKKLFERLSVNVIPKSYDLYLKPNFKNFVFEGKVTIKVVVNETTDKVVLNALDLKIQLVQVSLSNGTLLKPEFNLLEDDGTLTLTFPNPLPTGNATIYLEFFGVHNYIMKGFYRTKCRGTDGEEKFNVVTQFESTDARRCFPCWDEPTFKAVFDITLSVPEGKVALSNMPVTDSATDVTGERIVKFATTPIMSTYLVAVAVGEFDYIEGTSSDGVLVRVYTPVGKKEQGEFALHVATKVLPYYKDYFNIGYPLPKLDLIAVAECGFGAMENWGLVTFRETCLLVDSNTSSLESKQSIALVIGHELAHMWFGNLVTMEWWTHLWLNEGFASFIEFLCVAYLFPDYDIWTQFAVDTYIPALEFDSLKNSHPIEVPVGHPDEIDEIFDSISYNKGASIIRMLHNYIGDEDFRKGMHIYLTRFQYKNTFTEDLWAALEEASAKPVKAVMSNFTRQKGFPVISVDSSKQEGNVRVLTVSQRKFCADGSQDDNSHWMVPLSFSSKASPSKECQHILLETTSTTVTVNNVEPSDWVKVNPGTVGFYRTRYPSSVMEQFIPAIQNKTLPPLDSLGLLDDLFAMVQAGMSPTVDVLKLMEAMSNEDNYTVWCSISNCFSKLKVILEYTDFEDGFKAYGRKLFKNIGAQTEWQPKPKENHFDSLLRTLVLTRLGKLGDEEVIKESKKRFNDHVSGKCQIPADLRSVVYKTVLSAGDEETYTTMLKLYEATDVHEEQHRICGSFGAIRDEHILKKVLDFSITDKVRPQDTVYIIIVVAAEKLGRELAWNFMKANWNLLHERYKSGFSISPLVKSSTAGFAIEEKAAEIEEFFSTHGCIGGERAVQQACESIRLNAAWLKRDCESLRNYLAKISI